MKLSYTWYFNDWQTSQKVRRLMLKEKAVYRELIDLYYKDEGNVTIDEFWSEDFAHLNRSSIEEIEEILNRLRKLELIQITKNKLKIPSCDVRFEIIHRNRKNGAKNPKRTQNEPKLNPDLTQNEPTLNPDLSENGGKHKHKHKLKHNSKEKASAELAETLGQLPIIFDFTGDLSFRKNNFENHCSKLQPFFGTKNMLNFFNAYTKRQNNSNKMLFETIRNWSWELRIKSFIEKYGEEV